MNWIDCDFKQEVLVRAADRRRSISPGGRGDPGRTVRLRPPATAASSSAAGQTSGHPWEPAVRGFWDGLYGQFEEGMKHRVAPGTSPCIFDEQALYLSTDGGPLDVQLRRGAALIADLKKMPGVPTCGPSRPASPTSPRKRRPPRTPNAFLSSCASSRGRRRCPIRC